MGSLATETLTSMEKDYRFNKYWWDQGGNHVNNLFSQPVAGAGSRPMVNGRERKKRRLREDAVVWDNNTIFNDDQPESRPHAIWHDRALAYAHTAWIYY